MELEPPTLGNFLAHHSLWDIGHRFLVGLKNESVVLVTNLNLTLFESFFPFFKHWSGFAILAFMAYGLIAMPKFGGNIFAISIMLLIFIKTSKPNYF